MSDKTSDKRLLNCPFCGGEAELVGDKYHWVLCKDCKGGSHAFENVEEAIEKWNTRKPMQEIVKRLEKKIDNKLYNPNWNAGIIASISVVESVGGINEQS